MALYRKYRPATFAEVVGQRHVTDPLSAALESRDAAGNPNRINHAYLFSGPRGCGKTSSARIMARSLNCEHGPTATPCGKCASCLALAPGGPGNLDVIELDAASHNGVEDMRELREKAIFQPAESRYRIFIIDEAHMITASGFNALLKIVEEPPEHLIFIFATTEPEKVLPTIRSRTHHYPFRLLTPPDMRGLLESVVESEGVQVDPDVYPLVIQAGGGSPRDSLSVLDQLIAGSGVDGVDYETSAAILGVTNSEILTDAITALASGNRAELFEVVNRVIMSGQDPQQFALDLLSRVRDLLVMSAVPDAVTKGLVEIPESQVEEVTEQSKMIPPATLTRFSQVLSDGARNFRGVTSPRLLLEVLCARMLLPATEDSVEALLQRVESLERGIPAGGAGAGGGTGTGSGSGAGAGAADGSGLRGSAAPSMPQSGGAAGAGDASGMSARDAWRKRNAERKKSAGQRGQASAAAGQQRQQAQQPQVQPGQQAPVQQPEPVQQSDSAQQPQQERQGEPVQQTPQPAQSSAPGGTGETAEAARVRQLLEAREAAKRVQEYSRQQELAARQKEAEAREAATREREGEGGSLPSNWNADAPSAEVNVQQVQDEPAPRERESQSVQPSMQQAPSQQSEPVQPQQSEPAATQQPQQQQPEPTQEPAPDYFARIRDSWSEILQSVSGSHALAVRVLAAQAVPLELSGQKLTLGHSTGALANRLNSSDYAEALRAAVQSVTGADVQVQVVIGTRPRAHRATGAGVAPTAEDDSSESVTRLAQREQSAEHSVQEQSRANQQSTQAADQPAAQPAQHQAQSQVQQRLAARRARVEAAKREQEQRHNCVVEAQAQQSQQSAQPAQQLEQPSSAQPQQPQQRRSYRDNVLPSKNAQSSSASSGPTNGPASASASSPTSGYGDYDDVPPPPEPEDEYAPPSDYDSYSEEEEYLNAAQTEGNLDHRPLREVVIEMLEKELGARKA